MIIGVDARPLSRQLAGIGRYTLEMCRALENIPGVSLKLYSPSPIPKATLEGLEQASVKSMSWNSGLLRQLWSETYLPLWARADKVDVLWGPAHRLPRLLPRSIARVVTIHDLVWKHAGGTMRPLSRRLEAVQMPHAARSADMIAVDSMATGDDVVSAFGTDRKKLKVIYPATHFSGMMRNPTDVTQKFASSGIDKPYFLFVGTLEPRKNLSRLLEAFASLDKTMRARCPLVIVGGKGWGGVDLAQKVAALELTQWVQILGFVDDEILAALYANARFLAMPSLYEGFGLPLIEAMAHGVPVVTADNSSMPEIAGAAGLLVDAESVTSISDGLGRMIADKQLHKDLAAQAQDNAARFDWERSAFQLVELFEKAIAKRKRRRL